MILTRYNTNYAMFKSRVFVGNLRTDFLAKAEVEERFGKYGPVTGE